MESKRIGGSVLVACLVLLLVVSQEVQAHESKDFNAEKFVKKCLADCKENSGGAVQCKGFCEFLALPMSGGGPKELEAKLSSKSHKVKHAVSSKSRKVKHSVSSKSRKEKPGFM